ncbi:MAG: hypothetical protein ACI9QD_000969 [Thermoproteota archaeon]|jgi:hypothetical protein
MNKLIEDMLLNVTKSECIQSNVLIQELWSGYGQLTRIKLDKKSVILKLIKFPNQQDHPRGWNSDISHQRKVKSYNVEIEWYKNFNQKIKDSYIPRHIASGKIEDFLYLVLEDLNDDDFKPKEQLDFHDIKKCLKWLAHVHKRHLSTEPKNLWANGTYWHLETRPDELKVIDELELKNAAPLVNQKLNEATFKTIVHGDAKLSNFLFNNTCAAAVDFQYVGGGVGVKDVAYFLSSVYNEKELFQNEEACLDYYFKELTNSEVEKEWRELYPYAWCDFYRFLAGWSPGHWKLNAYSASMKEKVLKCL